MKTLVHVSKISWLVVQSMEEPCLRSLSEILVTLDFARARKFEVTLPSSKRAAVCRGRRGRGGRGRIGREEEEVSVAVTSSIVPGTCAYPAPRASTEEGCYIGGRSEEGEKKRKRPRQKVTAVRSEPSSGTLRERKWSRFSGALRCVPHHVTGYRDTRHPPLDSVDSSLLSRRTRTKDWRASIR